MEYKSAEKMRTTFAFACDTLILLKKKIESEKLLGDKA
jgi:hypothetical protein